MHPLTCKCFLMAMEEEPVRSLSSVMAAMIPALYDMMMLLVETFCRGGSVRVSSATMVRGMRMRISKENKEVP